MIADQRHETWGKDGDKGEAHVLTCLDMSASGERLINTFDYNLREEEFAAYSGKLAEKIIELVVTEFNPTNFGSRLRARGRIVAESVKLPMPEPPKK